MGDLIKNIKMEKGFICPFCGGPLRPPVTVQFRFGEADGNRCGCGAVYIYDRTGRNMGEAFSDALVYAFEGDYDAAYSAVQGDYEEASFVFSRRKMRFMPVGNRIARGEPKFVFVHRK